MATIDLSSDQLYSIARNYKIMKSFIMFPYRGWHVRLDQKPIAKGGLLSVEYTDSKGKGTGVWGYRISSFHIKSDNNYSITGQNENSEYFGKKINVEESEYVYFTYAGGHVWQPIWGYGKYEEKHKGQSVWRPDAKSQMSAEVWSFACNNARWFLGELSRVTKEDHGLAMGPVQGEKSNLFNQL